MNQVHSRNFERAYPRGSQTSNRNTSEDSSMSTLCETLGIRGKHVLEIPTHITSVMENFEFRPKVFVVEIEGPDFKFDESFHPDGIRMLSDGRRIFVNPNAGTDEFILKHTTPDVLTVTKLYAQRGLTSLLLFSGKRYGLLPLGVLEPNPAA